MPFVCTLWSFLFAIHISLHGDLVHKQLHDFCHGIATCTMYAFIGELAFFFESYVSLDMYILI